MYRKILGSGALALALTARGGGDQDVVIDETSAESAIAPAPQQPQTVAAQARAVIVDGDGAEIGTATLTQEGNGVRIVLDAAIQQSGELGFHLHEVGSCDGPDFASAGGHFNPTARSHGFDHPDGPHAGDMRNIEGVGSDGNTSASATNEFVTLAPGQPNSLFDADGTALVVHAAPDDYTSQPAGDAGPRVACGVIEAA